jgi:hypothetical protein
VSQVCRLPHVTPAFIHAQARRLHREERFLPGLLLLVVENEDPFPSEEPQDDSENRYRYIRGKYTGFIAGVD